METNGIQDFVIKIVTDYEYLIYLIILAWTFVEGETVVLVTGALIAGQNEYGLSIHLLVLVAFLGSFAGDQTYYYIGRRYGTALLKKWPRFQKKIDWAFRMVRTHETLFILTFRFLYGVRNFSPFVIGISGVPWIKFLCLNFIAALIWANSFAWGGYFLGTMLEGWLGTHKGWILLGFIGCLALCGCLNALRNRCIARRLKREEEQKQKAEDLSPSSDSRPPSDK